MTADRIATAISDDKKIHRDFVWLPKYARARRFKGSPDGPDAGRLCPHLKVANPAEEQKTP